MASFRVATINILSDLSRWQERRELLSGGLSELQPDLIAVQEASIPGKSAEWLADSIGYPHLFLTPKTGASGQREGIAILGRLPFERREWLDLQSQDRVAQAVQVQVAGTPLFFANTHLYWQPGDSDERLRQVERLLDWLKTISGASPVVVCGDFNAEPESQSIHRMRQDFASSYAMQHGREPEFTSPTPLPRSKRVMLKTLFRFGPTLLHLKSFRLDWRGTLDYIFVNHLVQVEECRLALDQPAPGRPKIYASDHFGLFARLKTI